MRPTGSIPMSSRRARPSCLRVVLLLFLFAGPARGQSPELYDLSPLFLRDPAILEAYEKFKSGAAREASRAMGEALARVPSDSAGHADLLYLAAEMARVAGEPEQERQRLRGVLGHAPLADRAHWRLGQLALRGGADEEAQGHFAAVGPHSPRFAGAQAALAEHARKRGRWTQAEAALRAAREHSRGAGRESHTIALATVLLRKAATRDEALSLLREIWETSRSASRAEEAHRLLVHHRARPSQVARQVRLVSRATGFNADQMARDLRGQRKRAKSREARARADYALGVVYDQRRKTRDESLRRLRVAWRATKSPELKGWILLAWARSLERSGEPAEARHKLERLLREAPRHAAARLGHLRLASLMVEAGQSPKAERLLAALTEASVEDETEREALWLLGWLRYRGARWAEAGEIFGRLARLPEDVPCCGDATWRERGGYWLARCLARQGLLEEAKSRWRALLHSRPFTYYAHLARARLRELGDASLPSRAARPTWSGEAPEALADLSRLRLRRDARLDTAVALLRLGLYEESRRDLEKRLLLANSAPDGLVLAGALRVRAGDVSGAHRLLRRHGRHGAWPDEGSELYWKLAYPVHYQTLAQKYGERMGLSPHLLLGLMRHESGFRPDARSYANALGLAQLLPGTARSIADRLLDRAAPSRAELMDPDTNLLIASRYLRELHNLFREDPALAVTAYNVGAGRVRAWLEGTDATASDEFVERLPYHTTAAYVRRVLAAAAAYALLYAPAPEAALEALLPPLALPESLGPYMVRDPALLAP